MVSRGRLFDLLDDQGFVAEDNGEWLGYATYRIEGGELEVTVLEALEGGRGAGSALLAACVGVAVAQRLRRAWLVTTNDNVDALRFYQRRGFQVAAVHVDSVTQARATLKPEIPLLGAHGIPIRDEIELEMPVREWQAFVARYGWPQS
jgi:hypothetical protein